MWKIGRPLKEKIGVDGGWNWIFGGLETFLDLFDIFRAKVEVPMDETSFGYNALTRRIDPRHPEGPRLHFSSEVDFAILHFSDFGPWARTLGTGPGPGPRAQDPGHRPRARAQGPGP